jgi:beta-lactamase regulating signal transducer with metallopeptidase domain
VIAAILDHLWQSTLLAAAVAIMALAFRKAPASVRYGLWLTASVKFLVPFAALGALGRLLAPAVRPPVEAAPDVAFVALAVQPFSPAELTTPPVHTALPVAHAAIAAHASAPLDPALVVLGVWALGAVVVLIIWMVRWAKIRPLLRRATPLALAAPMPVLATPTMLEPGLVGLWRPVLLVPETLFDHLDRPGIEALVAHETCHFRRRDNLTAAVHMLVEALFWFHPMVWWIGGRLVEERERACDEAVVRAGHDPAVYAESLLECCRLFLQSPLRCVAGASGSNLSRRVETIMTSPLRAPLVRSAKAALIIAAVFALASPVAAGWLSSPAEREVVSRAVAIASSPASALVAASMPDRSETAKTITPEKAGLAPIAPVRRIAALRPEPLKLDPDADIQTPPQPAQPLPPVTSAGVPEARLVRVTDSQERPATSPRAPGGLWLACKKVRILEPSPHVTHLCLAQSDWDKALPQDGEPSFSTSQ